ncbi:hypothetical protein [Methylorubrum sp. SB2]|uniref:hypothetical protein n=1 Tax=Methylorubrum subtropicum TaxID=3138812 RepID=UPI00313EC86A
MSDDSFYSELVGIPAGLDWDQAQDQKMAGYPSPHAYAWHYVNRVISETWPALEHPEPDESDEETLAECLVDIHNDAVERINKGISLVRNWAVINDVRLRLRGVQTADHTLIAWKGLLPLPERPSAKEPKPVRLRGVRYPR